MSAASQPPIQLQHILFVEKKSGYLFRMKTVINQQYLWYLWPKQAKNQEWANLTQKVKIHVFFIMRAWSTVYILKQEQFFLPVKFWQFSHFTENFVLVFFIKTRICGNWIWVNNNFGETGSSVAINPSIHSATCDAFLHFFFCQIFGFYRHQSV